MKLSAVKELSDKIQAAGMSVFECKSSPSDIRLDSATVWLDSFDEFIRFCTVQEARSVFLFSVPVDRDSYLISDAQIKEYALCDAEFTFIKNSLQRRIDATAKTLAGLGDIAGVVIKAAGWKVGYREVNYEDMYALRQLCAGSEVLKEWVCDNIYDMLGLYLKCDFGCPEDAMDETVAELKTLLLTDSEFVVCGNKQRRESFLSAFLRRVQCDKYLAVARIRAGTYGYTKTDVTSAFRDMAETIYQQYKVYCRRSGLILGTPLH